MSEAVKHPADDAAPPASPSDPAAAGETAAPAIRVRGLTNQFDDQVVHKDLDLDVRVGEVLGVVGASGSGKSVLLRSIVGLNRPQAGSIQVLGRDVEPGEIDDYLKTRIGVLFQDGALFSSLTVAENVEVPLREHFPTLDDATVSRLARLKIRLAGLKSDAADKYPAQLSGGMRKRAGIARALACDPELLFLDEPTAGLDPIGAAAFDELIRTLSDALGLTVFLVTHDLDTLYAICDRVAALADGKVLAVDTVEALQSFDHPWLHEYFNGPRARAAQNTGQSATPPDGSARQSASQQAESNA